MIFNDQELAEIESLKKRYEQPAAALLPVLWRLQDKLGWIDIPSMQVAADLCEVPLSHVKGVVTFYTMFFDKPMGRYHVQVCTNVSCMLCGAEKLYESVKSKLGLQNWGRTEDGMFSLEEMECMGACGGAPVMGINETFFEKMSIEELDNVLETIRDKQEIPKPKFVKQLPELSDAANG